MSFTRSAAAGVAVGVLALAMSAPAAYAQQTTGAIRGAVVDGKGAPIRGADVVILHMPTGTQTKAKTNDAGGFDVSGLRVGGPYKITASAPGGATQTVEDIYLTVGDAQRVKLTVEAASDVAEVVVTAAKVGATSQLANVGSRTTLRHDNIEAVVSVKRDIRDIGRRDPLANLDLVSRSTGPSGGLYIAGSSPRANRITIDGVRSQDSFGLNTGGLSTNRGPVSFEALEQMSIQAVPFDVEDGDFTGGALNLILRSGGNDFHGSAFSYFRSSRLNGNELPIFSYANGDVTTPNPTKFGKVQTKIDETNYGFFLSGPIWKDKLFFAASYEKFTSSDTTGFGPVGAGFANTFAKIPGISTGAGASQSDIDAVLKNYSGYAASSLLKPGQVSLIEPIIDEKASIKLDYNITDDQRLTATYRHANSSVWKRSPSATNIYLDTNWYVQPEVEDNYAIQLNSRWTPTFSTEARVTYRAYQRGQEPPEGQGFAQIGICGDATSIGATFTCSSGVPSIFFGPDQFRQANVLKTQEWSGEFIGTYRGFDHHLIKFGTQYRGVDIFDLFVQQAHGVYYFDSVADFAAGVANQLSYGGPVAGSLNDAAAKLSYYINTFLVQDTWDITDGLTLNYGLRYDRYNASGKPTLNPNFVTRYGFNNQTNYDGIGVLMPRVSAKWRTTDFQLSGGFGLVSGGVPDVFLTNSYGANTGALTNSFAIRRQADGTYFDTASSTIVSPAVGAALLNINKADPSFINSASPTVATLLSADSANRRNAYTNSLAPGFKMPADWKANVSFRTTYMGFDFGIDAVATMSQNGVAFRDLRARRLTINGVQQYTPDGRIRYDGLTIPGNTPAEVNANRAALGLPVSSNPDLANLGLLGDIEAYNPSQKSWTETLAFSVGRNWRGLDAFVSYTLQRGRSYGGISEFGTTAGGNATTSAYYPDQTFDYDPNASDRGRAGNIIEGAFKANLSYKIELWPRWVSRFTLFGESHSGRPISFLMTDPLGNRNPTFGVSRDDALAYIPNIDSPDPGNPLKFTTGGTTVFFDSAASVAKFKALVNQFNLQQGRIANKGVRLNPSVSRLDFQFAQEVPTPVFGSLLFTLDIANLGNLINNHWGVVKEYSNSRAGAVIVNAQCADAAGNVAGVASATCATYKYTYTTASPTVAAVPTVDQAASLWSIVLGVKFKF